MSRFFLVGFGLVLLQVFRLSSAAAEGGWPEGFRVAEHSTSPNGRYGVLIPGLEQANDDDEKTPNTLVDLQTKKQLAVIHSSHYVQGLNHRGLTVAWATDSSCCTVVFEGRYGFDTITALEHQGSTWTQTDLGKAIQKGLDGSIAKQARSASVGGLGSAHFRFAPGRKILVRATAYTNPKAMDDQPTYNALFQGTFDLAAGKWTRSEARKITDSDAFEFAFSTTLDEDTTFGDPADRLKRYDEWLNDVYGVVRTVLPPARFAAVKKEQVAWLQQLATRKSAPEKCEFIGARIRQLRELVWSN
jgi:hypothetical protein